MRTNGKLLALTATGAATTLALAGVAKAAPIWEFNFNDSGVGAANTGTDAQALITDQSVYGAPANDDLHGAAGSGVSAAAGDMSLNLTAMGTDGRIPPGVNTSHVFVANANIGAIGTLSQFTVSTWVKLSTPLSTYATPIGRPYLGGASSYTRGFNVQFRNNTGTGNNSIRFSVGGGSSTTNGNATWGSATDATVEAAMPLAQTGTWVFLAFTYDGTLTSNNADLYIGTDTSPAVLIGGAPKTINAGTMALPTNDFVIGRDPANNSGFLAGSQFDNFRIDGGVLDLTTLEARRVSDGGTSVPEPAGLGLLGIVGAGMLARRRRRV